MPSLSYRIAGHCKHLSLSLSQRACLIDLAFAGQTEPQSQLWESLAAEMNESWTRGHNQREIVSLGCRVLPSSRVQTHTHTHSRECRNINCELCDVDFSFQWGGRCCTSFWPRHYLFICLALAVFGHLSIHLYSLSLSFALSLSPSLCLVWCSCLLWCWPHINPTAC